MSVVAAAVGLIAIVLTVAAVVLFVRAYVSRRRHSGSTDLAERHRVEFERQLTEARIRRIQQFAIEQMRRDALHDLHDASTDRVPSRRW